MITLTHRSTGAYDMYRNRTLAWDEDTGIGVLIRDEFCGQGSPEGGMYRPYLHTLDGEATRTAIAAWEDDWQAYEYQYAEALSSGVRYWGEIAPALKRHIKRSAST
jgi:hypothetical protein